EVDAAQALLGLAEGGGEAALVGTAAAFAPALAARLPEMEWIAVHPATHRWSEAPGVARLAASERLPFADRSLRGVLVRGLEGAAPLRDAARVVAPGSRVAVLEAPEGAAATLMGAGLKVVLEDAGVVVARR
ncbi:MAG: hypothetical protein RQ751_12690, partial [Longimicrobiales bacterium]|nr:hypothetical protein [Longimicrobiales bacterium]